MQFWPVVLLAGIIAILFAAWLARDVLSQDRGTKEMQEVASLIFEGAMAFLNRQYRTIAVLALAAAVIIGAVPLLLRARRAALEPYRLDDSLLDLAAPHAVALHCLPAHPGEEITTEVLYGERQRGGDGPRIGDAAQHVAMARQFGERRPRPASRPRRQ